MIYYSSEGSYKVYIHDTKEGDNQPFKVFSFNKKKDRKVRASLIQHFSDIDSSTEVSTDQGIGEAAAGQLSPNTVRTRTDGYVPSPLKLTQHYQGPEPSPKLSPELLLQLQQESSPESSPEFPPDFSLKFSSEEEWDAQPRVQLRVIYFNVYERRWLKQNSPLNLLKITLSVYLIV